MYAPEQPLFCVPRCLYVFSSKYVFVYNIYLFCSCHIIVLCIFFQPSIARISKYGLSLRYTKRKRERETLK